ncbi:MAG: hypothetical protein Q9198_010127, partial [Flavoplaca austrocitrina]
MPPHAKSSNPIRRVSSGLAKVSTPPTSSRNNKTSNPSIMICLKLSTNALRRFAPDPPETIPSPGSPTKHAPEVAPQVPALERESKTVQHPAEASSPPEAAAASEVPQSAAKDPLGKNTAKESTPKTGSKRGLGAGVEGPKPRARPGPKKKIKIDDTNGDNAGSAAKAATTSVPAHKLGPKANQGAINAGLRALDRTGKPCRKWEKNGFRLKTFTGVTWELPTWRAPPKSFGSGDSPGKGSLPTSNSQSKENNSSSQVGSDNSASTPVPATKMQPSSVRTT